MTEPLTELRLRLPLAHFELQVEYRSSARSLGIFGASGAGKTSLLEVLAGWRPPTRGHLRLAGTVLYDGDTQVSLPIERRGAGYVPQDVLLLPHWSVGRNVRAGLRSGGSKHEDEAAVARTCAVLEIEHLLERSPAGLSGGERQRVALARALVSRPRFLLLDEPLGALDLPLRRRILPYLIRVRDQFALPTIFVSHDATEIQALCDEVLVLEHGRVRASGTPSEVLLDLQGTCGSFENVLRGSVTAATGGTAQVELDDGGQVHVPAAGLEPGMRALFALGSDDILLALDAPRRISARNLLPGRVERIDELGGGAVRVVGRLADGQGARLAASLTRTSAAELGLREGGSVHFVFKTNSCRVLSAPGRTAEEA
jgi:molybdate transport system ATP-binding protein